MTLILRRVLAQVDHWECVNLPKPLNPGANSGRYLMRIDIKADLPAIRLSITAVRSLIWRLAARASKRPRWQEVGVITSKTACW